MHYTIAARDAIKRLSYASPQRGRKNPSARTSSYQCPKGEERLNVPQPNTRQSRPVAKQELLPAC